MAETRKPHRPSRLGLALARIPPVRWLYPLYAARQLRLVEQTLAFSALPDGLDGLRIAYASDIHYGAYMDEARIRDLAERLNALNADILLLGGDYGEYSDQALEYWRKTPSFHARLAVFGVLGNHDRIAAGARVLGAAMARKGVTPLVNSACMITRNHARLCATDDWDHGRPDFVRVARLAQGADFTIFAPHSPDALQEAYAAADPPFFQLALCGHTHGGQVAVLGIAPIPASRLGWRYGNKYRTGILREKGVTVLISNGVGTSWLPIRLGAPAQFHLITLKKA